LKLAVEEFLCALNTEVLLIPEKNNCDATQVKFVRFLTRVSQRMTIPDSS
jgi:hypothetical protein